VLYCDAGSPAGTWLRDEAAGLSPATPTR
jgi:hypothetical protein